MKWQKILVCTIAIILVIVTLFTSVIYASEILPENYIIDNTNIMSRYYIDLIDNAGKELENNGVKLILVVNKELANNNAYKTIRDQYYQWYGQLKNGVKLVVVNYYLEENILVVFDENQNYVSSKTILKTQGNLERYKNKADIESGMYYAYSVVAKAVADKLNFTLENIDTTPKYTSSNWFKSMPGILGSLIIITLAFSFRKRK